MEAQSWTQENCQVHAGSIKHYQEVPDMTKYVQWIEYKGKRLLYVDFSGIQDEAVYLGAIGEVEEEICSQPAGTMVPLLLNVSDTHMTMEVSNRSKQLMAAASERGIPDSPTAIVGMSGIQKAVVQAMQFLRPDIHVAPSIEDAKDWLAEQVGDLGSS